MSRTKRFFNDVILGTVNSSDITIRTGSESMTSSPATIMSNTPFDETKPDRIAVATTCVKHLAETLGRIIPFVYRMDSKKGKVKAKEHYLYDLIHYQPNSWTNSHTFYQTLEYHRNFKGNAYALIKRNEATGRAEAFEVITPSRVKGSVKEKGELYYLIVNEKGDKVEPNVTACFQINWCWCCCKKIA
jgi:phage portal protein BeeE